MTLRGNDTKEKGFNVAEKVLKKCGKSIKKAQRKAKKNCKTTENR